VSIMNDGVPMCDLCEHLCPSSGYIELWPRMISGPYGPDRVDDPGFGACADCLRHRFAEHRMRDLRLIEAAHRRFLPEAREAWERGRAVFEAEAIIRDAELELGRTE
jgi:hypothetical protein